MPQKRSKKPGKRGRPPKLISERETHFTCIESCHQTISCNKCGICYQGCKHSKLIGVRRINCKKYFPQTRLNSGVVSYVAGSLNDDNFLKECDTSPSEKHVKIILCSINLLIV